MGQMNKAIKREHHITPTIKEMIGDLNRAKVFTKLGLTQGYNLLELVQESRYITKFGTHMGLMHYKHVNFRTSSALKSFNMWFEKLWRVSMVGKTSVMTS